MLEIVLAIFCFLSLAGLATTDSPAAWAAVPLALEALTAEFGMGSGGIPPLVSPVRLRTELHTTLLNELASCMPGLFTRHGTVLGDQANRAIRTSKLNTSLYLHTWPIDEVVFLGSQAKPSFEVSFPLRCFQRLSRPYIATRQCGWRHNRSTRGTFLPVLSY